MKLGGGGSNLRPLVYKAISFGRSSLTNEKDHHYFLNRFVCVGEFFDG